MLESLRDELEAFEEPEVVKDPVRELIGKQHAQVEEVINFALAGVCKKLAHEIRLKIAKSDNKLAALQLALGA